MKTFSHSSVISLCLLQLTDSKWLGPAPFSCPHLFNIWDNCLQPHSICDLHLWVSVAHQRLSLGPTTQLQTIIVSYVSVNDLITNPSALLAIPLVRLITFTAT